MAQFLPLKTEIESAFAGEPDLARPPAEYDTAVADAIEKSAARISHPAQRKAFTLSAIDDVAATMKGLAQEREKQAQLQGLTADLDALRTTALKIPGDDGKAKIIDTSRALIGGQGNISGDEGTDRAIELGILLTLGRLLGRSGGILKPGSAPAKIPPATGTADAPGGTTILKELGPAVAELAGKATNDPEDGAKPPSLQEEFLSPNRSTTEPSEGESPPDQTEDDFTPASSELTRKEAEDRVRDAAYELRKSALRLLPPAATLRGDELGDTSNKKELRISAKAYMRDNFIKRNFKVINEQTGFERLDLMVPALIKRPMSAKGY